MDAMLQKQLDAARLQILTAIAHFRESLADEYSRLTREVEAALALIPGDGGVIISAPDAIDPREFNTTHHNPPPGQDGKVDAVHLTVHPAPGVRKYRCIRTQLLSDDPSCNIYVSVVDNRGRAIMVNVMMATGYQGNANTFHAYMPPGNPNGSFFMGSDSRFLPPNVGPLAIMIREGNEIVSDVVGSLGLARGQHMSYFIVFREV